MDLSTSFNTLICVNSADDVLADMDIGDTHDFTMYICPESVYFNNNPAVSQIAGNKSWYLDKFGSYPFVGKNNTRIARQKSKCMPHITDSNSLISCFHFVLRDAYAWA